MADPLIEVAKYIQVFGFSWFIAYVGRELWDSRDSIRPGHNRIYWLLFFLSCASAIVWWVSEVVSGSYQLVWTLIAAAMGGTVGITLRLNRSE